ncbi:MAG: alkane 1-monooxygenase [Wenzhouxiangella sp.]|jgi:alkane 1-monooxygenase|nr:alkane 1-monooxygenase [Wenzhouxiangella sp.]
MNDLAQDRSSPKASSYIDRKRQGWLLSVALPLLPVAAIGVQIASGSQWALVLPLLVVYALVPLLDALLGEDRCNPPASAVPGLEEDRYYRVLTWLTVPLYFASLVICVAWAVLAPLPWAAWLALAWSTGLVGGLAVNTGHELGHKRTRIEQFLARLALAVPGYGHFGVEHNFGHHRAVATPEDSASARYGESIYQFARREMPGGLRRAILIERRRQARRGRGFFTVHNEILQSWLVTFIVQGGLVAWLGSEALMFLLLHNAVAWWQLTSANYVEHYGLLRGPGSKGGYERCRPRHSWNSNHVVSNLLLFHLERHSDHHAHPQRRYQSLRDFPDLPRLPSGYFGMFLLAYVPPLWFRVMNPRLLALPHVQGDLGRVNRVDERDQALVA